MSIEALSTLANQTAGKIDPNIPQRRASDPDSSVWVGASAGSGKTKVLTDRVLRLLLPRDDGRSGTAVYKILCLTFTKAAASEMALRVSQILARWAVIPLDELCEKLEGLYGRVPRENEILAARRLFADVVDAPGGLKIMTIHSFCQSILGRFPVEADINPQFKVLEESDARELMNKARMQVISKNNSGDENARFRQALRNVSLQLNEEQFGAVLSSFSSHRRQFFEMLADSGDVEGIYHRLCSVLEIDANLSEEEILSRFCDSSFFDEDGLRQCVSAMSSSSTKKEPLYAQDIQHWLDSDVEKRVEGFEAYKSIFLTTSGDLRSSSFPSSKTAKTYPDVADILATEGARILRTLDQIKRVKTAVLTRDITYVAKDILKNYERLKSFEGGLDFDDLIDKTLKLLVGKKGAVKNSSWVQYKLDQGIDHILVDEAQDTNPNQWGIIDALCEDFFSGHGAREDGERTVFVVGDEKQSIYSFQGASREMFEKMRGHFAQKVQASGARWDPVSMDVSFRSVHAVLQAVDSVFSDDTVRCGVSSAHVQHYAFRTGQGGLVETWPVFQADDLSVQGSLWDVPVDVQTVKSGSQKLADFTAQQIKGWIDNGEILKSHGRAIQPGDIMVLVRRRNAFVAQLSRALKTLGVNVGGVDRMVLGDQLAVQDMMAALRFALLPQNDLNLACLLKSPFIGMDEDGLFDLAYDRASDLWLRMKEAGDERILSYLRELILLSRRKGPYDVLSHILQSPCPADEVSGRCALIKRLGTDALDAVNEFMSAALEFQHNKGSSLQQFVYEQDQSNTEVKREQDEGGDFVRIMTVHGSKGLQAPIVILPDTTSGVSNAPHNAGERVLWPEERGLDVPIWTPYKELETKIYSEIRSANRERLESEHYRLLYVAMTRAEDRLYVGGYKGKNDIDERCWYNLVQRGLAVHPDHETLEEGLLRLSYDQVGDADRTPKDRETKVHKSECPAWLYEKVHTAIDMQVDVLNPSLLEEVAFSPVSDDQNGKRFLRGNLTHKLLQILPVMDASQHMKVAESYLKRFGQDLSESVRRNIAEETLKVLSHPDFYEIFSSKAQAEVPISGVIDGVGFISGQIDRLLVSDDRVFFVDYKTNRPPPQRAEDVPKAYRNQLNAYGAILRQIYPNKSLYGALLWTDGPNLMPIEIEV